MNIDYHIEVGKAFYSVPHSAVRLREQVDVRLTATTVEILHKGRRLASHPRQYRKGAHSRTRDICPAFWAWAAARSRRAPGSSLPPATALVRLASPLVLPFRTRQEPLGCDGGGFPG